MWPGHEGLYQGQSPHGAYLKLYANSIALKAAREGKREMPNGAILVKENYGRDKTTLMAVTPMYKAQGYDPAAGDWFWAKYGPNGEVMKAGKVKGCINCHSVVQAKDWRFTGAKQTHSEAAEFPPVERKFLLAQ
ncbi:MAG: cytochrome P460 family protein [Syntrophobacteria bacterium]